jgi:hypothetical protein
MIMSLTRGSRVKMMAKRVFILSKPISKIISFDPKDSDEDNSREENDDDTLIKFL